MTLDTLLMVLNDRAEERGTWARCVRPSSWRTCTTRCVVALSSVSTWVGGGGGGAAFAVCPIGGGTNEGT